MRNPQRQLYATFGVTLLLTGCVSQQTIGTGAADKCEKFIKVTSTNDPHLALEEQFRIKGPNNDGDYRLRPIGGGHQVTSKDHPVIKSAPGGKMFEAEIEIKSSPGGPHGSVTMHYYSIVMELDTSGCPSKLNLDTKVHDGDVAGQAHGGDAVMN